MSNTGGIYEVPDGQELYGDGLEVVEAEEIHRGTTIIDLEQTVVSAEERAKLFRQSTRALLPEFAYLIKHEGDSQRIPHDCFEHLSRDLNCQICGAHYEPTRLAGQGHFSSLLRPQRNALLLGARQRQRNNKMKSGGRYGNHPANAVNA